MENIRGKFQVVLDSMVVSDLEIDAFAELAYTARETGLLDIRLVDDYTIEFIIKLAKLSKKYKKGVPSELCI